MSITNLALNKWREKACELEEENQNLRTDLNTLAFNVKALVKAAREAERLLSSVPRAPLDRGSAHVETLRRALKPFTQEQKNG